MDEAFAGVGMALPPWLQHMTEQEQAGQAKAILQILIRPAVLPAVVLRTAEVLTQERRQPQQPVLPGIAGPPRYRAAGFRRDIDQIGGAACRGAIFQIEAEAERRPASPARISPYAPRQRLHRRNRRECARPCRRYPDADRAPATAAPVMPDGSPHRPQRRTPARSPHATECLRSRKCRDVRRAAPARPRRRCYRAVAAAASANWRRRAAEAEVTAMLACQQFDDGAGFAMPPHPEHDALVGSIPWVAIIAL